MPKPKLKYTYAVVGISIKTYKVFLHMTQARDKKAARDDFFQAYKFGEYGILEVVELPKERKEQC